MYSMHPSLLSNDTPPSHLYNDSLQMLAPLYQVSHPLDSSLPISSLSPYPHLIHHAPHPSLRIPHPLTCTMILSRCWHLCARSVIHCARVQFGGGAESPSIWHQTAGILWWKRSSAMLTSLSDIWSPNVSLGLSHRVFSFCGIKEKI